MTTSKPPCVTCGNSKEWHDANPQTQHVFNDGSVPMSATFGRKRADGSKEPLNGPQRGAEPAVLRPPEMQSRWPFDPVLRQALIDKGVLTPQDLRDAEETIKAVTAAFNREVQG